jgi:hypothetical protein
MEFKNPLDILDEPDLPVVPNKPKSGYQNPLAVISKHDVAKAAQKTGMTAGRFIRKQGTWTESQIDLIKTIAVQEGMSELATMRWLIDLGLQAYVAGERPEMQEVIRRSEPKLKYG